MSSKCTVCLICFFIFTCCVPRYVFTAPTAHDDICKQYSDTFSTFEFDRWQEVLIYSETPGNISVRDGKLLFQAPPDVPCEIQLYSLFAFEGDFDIQSDYELPPIASLAGCTFNSGLILQSEGDENSYKCYISMKPDKGLTYRARLDYHGETKIEGGRLNKADQKGTIRVNRTDGTISFYTLSNGSWQLIYSFKKSSDERLRLRYKLQTQSGGDSPNTCNGPAIFFDNFRVNSCDQVVSD